MFAVKSKFKVGAATSVVATSTVLGASVVVLEDADGTAVEPGIPTVPPCAVNLIATIPEPPRPPLINTLFDCAPPPPPPPVCLPPIPPGVFA